MQLFALLEMLQANGPDSYHGCRGCCGSAAEADLTTYCLCAMPKQLAAAASAAQTQAAALGLLANLRPQLEQASLQPTSSLPPQFVLQEYEPHSKRFGPALSAAVAATADGAERPAADCRRGPWHLLCGLRGIAKTCQSQPFMAAIFAE